jgi:hypothetical protein
MTPEQIQEQIDIMLNCAQTLSILCAQLEREVTQEQWPQEYRDNARRAWRELNRAHKELTMALEKQPA